MDRRLGVLGAAAAVVVALGAPAAAAERGATDVALTAAFVRSGWFHDGSGQLVEARLVGEEGGVGRPIAVDAARLSLDVVHAVSRSVALSAHVPVVLIDGYGPVERAFGLGDSRGGASLALPAGAVVLEPALAVLLPTGDDAPGAPPPDGAGRRAVTGAGLLGGAAGVAARGHAGPVRWDAHVEGRAWVPGPVRYLSHPDAYDEPDFSAVLERGPELDVGAGVGWAPTRWLGAGLAVRHRQWWSYVVRRARRVELLDSRGTEFDAQDDVGRSVLVGPERATVPGSAGRLLLLTPSVEVPALGLRLEADLVVDGRSSRPLHAEAVAGTGTYEAGRLGAEENAWWPLEPTGLRLAGGVLLGEVRLVLAR